MDLDLTADQTALLAAIEPLLLRYRQLPQPAAPEYRVYGQALDAELQEGGFYGDGEGSGLERADAALLLSEIARCPYAVPAMASLLVAPLLPRTLPRPFALMTGWLEPTRFLAESRTALLMEDDRVLAVDLDGVEVQSLQTIFAFPYGRLTAPRPDRSTLVEGVGPAELANAWRLGLVFEILGALRSAHALTTDYVKQRVQFKKPIGGFQAVQHRLGEGATHIEALGYLGGRAAWSGEAADIALAAAYAQKQVGQIVYDCHQFHGAMGLTLEYVLHHWTYRLKVLAGELGGASAQARAAVRSLWGSAA